MEILFIIGLKEVFKILVFYELMVYGNEFLHFTRWGFIYFCFFFIKTIEP